MEVFAYIVPWVFGSLCVGVAAGFFVGRNRSRLADTQETEQQRRTVMNVLVELLTSAEQISTDVKCHNSEIQETAQHVGGLSVSGEMVSVKNTLLGQISALLTSNNRLQGDLDYSRYRMEEQAQQIDHARREARTDTLTDVANRKAFDEKLHLLTAGWNREGQPFAVILIDVDLFKRINDAHGHQVGDRVLSELGTWLKQWVREGDFVGRYGGDEFAILMPHAEFDVGMERATMICQKTAENTSCVAVRGEQISISLSIGVAAPEEGDTAESILRRADQALYVSKDRGRNQVNGTGPSEKEIEPDPASCPPASNL